MLCPVNDAGGTHSPKSVHSLSPVREQTRTRCFVHYGLGREEPDVLTSNPFGARPQSVIEHQRTTKPGTEHSLGDSMLANTPTIPYGRHDRYSNPESSRSRRYESIRVY